LLKAIKIWLLACIEKAVFLGYKKKPLFFNLFLERKSYD